MHGLFLHHQTFARLEAGLKPFSDRLQPLLISDDGQFSQPPESMAGLPIISYGTQEIYFSKAAPAFFKTLVEHPDLAWFQSSAAGLEHPLLQAIGRNAGRYTNSHAQSEGIAEWVLWAGLDYFQRGAERRAQQARRTWRRIPFRELSQTRWLIIGFGHIGQATGRRLRALGAHVTGVRRSAGDRPEADRMIGPEEVHDVLGTVDAVLLCLPHTPDTENLANAAFFAAMAPGSLFLNVGRGALVDEAALLAGLARGAPAHAALDVVREEPYGADGPFWTSESVTLTPHISAFTDGSKYRTDEIFLRNLAHFMHDRTLECLIDRRAFD